MRTNIGYRDGALARRASAAASTSTTGPSTPCAKALKPADLRAGAFPEPQHLRTQLRRHPRRLAGGHRRARARIRCGAWRAPFVRVTGGANHQNFWWAHRQNLANGELVNQFHTENGGGSAPAATGESEIGWRFELTGGRRPAAPLGRLRPGLGERDRRSAGDRRAAPAPGGVAAGGRPARRPPGVAERVVQRGQAARASLELEVSLGRRPGLPGDRSPPGSPSATRTRPRSATAKPSSASCT